MICNKRFPPSAHYYRGINFHFSQNDAEPQRVLKVLLSGGLKWLSGQYKFRIMILT